MIRLDPGVRTHDTHASTETSAPPIAAAPRELLVPPTPRIDVGRIIEGLRKGLIKPDLQSQLRLLGRGTLAASSAALVGANTLFGAGAAIAHESKSPAPRARPVAERVLPAHTFPIAGGRYNIGYDARWNRFEQGSARHNSDFSRRQTDARHTRGHLGVDIFGPRGAPVVAPVQARVVAVGTSRVGGHYVTLQAGNRRFYMAHLDSHARGLRVGQTVHAGDALGTLGNTGSARGTAPHVHFEMRVDGNRVDPFDYLMSLR